MPTATTRTTKARATVAPPKPKTLREELIVAGKERSEPVDHEAVLRDIRETLTRMDDAVDRMSDAADAASVNLAINLGATPDQVETMQARLAAKQAAKKAARDGGDRPHPESSAAASKLPLPEATTTIPAVSTKRNVDRRCRPCGWQAPQDAQTRSKALQDGAPPAPEGMLRCWGCFPDLPPACGCDWLGRGSAGEKDRPGQPMKRFLQPGPHRNFPTRQRSKIYLVPLGDVSGAPPASVFADLLRRWFLLDVQVMKPPTGKALDALERDPRGCGYGQQIEAPSAHKLLQSVAPRDAFIVLGYTMEDICNSAKGFGFLFSFARYADGVDRSSARFLRRCGMVLCHEATHLFGVKHCVYACCLMNGSNHLEESESRPFNVCPVDLRKIQLTLDQAKVGGRDQPPIDLVARERGLVEWFEAHGLKEDARFSRNVLGSLTGQPEPEPPAEAAQHEATGGV